MKTRIILEKPSAAGNRFGWWKQVYSVNETNGNGFDLEGEFLRNNREMDLETGSVLICKSPQGSVKTPRWKWSAYLLGAISETEPTLEELFSRDGSRFLTFRDALKHYLETNEIYTPDSMDRPTESRLAVLTQTLYNELDNLSKETTEDTAKPLMESFQKFQKALKKFEQQNQPKPKGENDS